MSDVQATPASSDAPAPADSSAIWNEIVDKKSANGRDDAPPPPPAEPEPEAPDAEAGEADDEDEGDEAGEGDADDARDADDSEPEDPWQAVPEDLRTEHDALVEKLKKYEHENRSNRARIPALQRKVDQLAAALAAAQEGQKPKEPQFDIDALFGDDWKQFETDYADVAKPIKAAISRSVSELRQEVEQARKLSETLSQSLQAQTAVSKTERLGQLVPDWIPLIRDNQEDFRAFVDGTGDYSPVHKLRKEIEDSNRDEITDPDAVAWLLKEFKTHLAASKPAPSEGRRKPSPTPPAPLSPKRQAQLSSASSVPPRSHSSQGRRSTDLPETDDPVALWNHLAEQADRRMKAR